MSLINYTNTFQDDPPQIASGDEVQQSFDEVTAVVNGNLDDTNIATGGVGTTSIAAGAVTDPKVAAGISGTKIAAGTLPLSALGFPLAGGPGNVPIGAMFDWLTGSAPPQYLLAQGQTVSQVTYALLYSLFGTAFNTGGEAPGTFRLPDLRGRLAVGLGTAAVINTIGKNEGLVGFDGGGVAQPANVAARTPNHDHDWVLPNHTHDIPPHSHDSGTLNGTATIGTILSGQVSSSGAPLKWAPALEVSTPTSTTVTAGPNLDITGASSNPPPAHTHSLSAHTHGLNNHKHNNTAVTGTVGGPALVGTVVGVPETAGTAHQHNTAIGNPPVAITAGSTGTGVSASTTTNPSATGTQTTAVDTGAYFTVNRIIYAGV